MYRVVHEILCRELIRYKYGNIAMSRIIALYTMSAALNVLKMHNSLKIERYRRFRCSLTLLIDP